MNLQDKAKSRIFWQYKNAPKLISLIMALPSIAQASIEDQLSKIKNIIDIDNAEGEQLDICGRIVGYATRPSVFLSPTCTLETPSDDIYRKIIKAKIYKNTGFATIDEIKTAADYILGVDTLVHDAQNMKMRLVFTGEELPLESKSLLINMDLIPRPQGVGLMDYRQVTFRPFGFGKYYKNFNNGAFWPGDGLDNYRGKIILTLNGDSITGRILLNNSEISISDIDITITYTDSAGNETHSYVVTDENGEFILTIDSSMRYIVSAKSQLITPLCSTLNLKSNRINLIT